MAKRHIKGPGKYRKEQPLKLDAICRTTDRPHKKHCTVGPRGSQIRNNAASNQHPSPKDIVDLQTLHEHQPIQPSHEEPQPSTSRYHKQKQREINAWNDVRQRIFDTSVKLCAPITNTCSICREEEWLCLYRCADCGPTATFCIECLRQHHRNSLHQPEVWQDHCFQPMLGICNFLHRVDHPSCPSSYYKEVRVFDSSGRLRFVNIEFCKCEPELCTLVRYGLWGASECPQTAFSMSLLEWLVVLSNECHVSVEGFCNSVRWKNNLSLPEVNSLYRSLVGEPISEFRHFLYKKSTLTGLSPSLDDGTCCPACPKQNGEKIIMLDGNFGLVRKASSGTSIAPPHHGSRMFVKDEVVKTFLSSYKDESKPDEDCSNFEAGTKIRSKNAQKKLDVSGIFGSACRHEMPIQFLNMSRGESLGYPVLLIQQLIEKEQLNNNRLKVVYDIGCVLEAHLKRTGQADLLKQLDLSVPIFHLYGHKTPCQILYSTRRKDGFGLTDGEGMERLWSYLRLFSRSTKEMTPTHRIDLLTDALLHFARRKSTDIEAALLQRMDKAEKMKELSEEKICDVTKQAPVPVTETDMRRLDEEEQQSVRRKKKTPKAAVRKWEKDYVTSLHDLHSLQETILRTEDGTDVAVHQAIRKHDSPMLWGNESLYLPSMYNGQAIAKKLCKQLQSINSKLEKTVKHYNNMKWPPKHITFPRVVDIKDARDPYWDVYLKLDVSVRGEGDLPYSLQRKAIDAISMKKRALEEIQMVKGEMREVLIFQIQQVEDLQRTFLKTENVGERAAIQEKLIQLQLRLGRAVGLFKPHVPHVPELPPFLPFIPVNDTYDYTLEDLDNFDSIDEQDLVIHEEDELILD
ncbi:uncharacterized protein LOC144880223 [Branchiostoma floridae x Branchiostoma japonicum]